MRYLNKIAFINSAAIKYAEVTLDGNVHFIGTQGVGKSTLLRAILFFYNGDTQKLGISKEKKSFTEYYFPYANSYIIYEVMRETGAFCIQAFKSQGKVCFRFIDSPYNRDHYVGPDGLAYDNRDTTRNILNKEVIDYSTKIDRFEDYRDILYGNSNSGKSYRKYALMESRQYQNIPRTIQNVFLNSRLEAEFIKQTIIMSMNEDDVTIDLQNYTHHLKDFDTHLGEIQKFRQPSVLKQASSVAEQYAHIRHLDRDRREIAQQLGWSLTNIRKQENELTEKLLKEEAKREKQLTRLGNAENLFINKKARIQSEINVLDDKLKIAKKKNEEYQRVNIQQIIAQVASKGSLEREAQDLVREKELLSATYKEVTQKYDALLKELSNQQMDYENHNKQEKLEAESEFLKRKEEIREATQKLMADIRIRQEEKLSSARALTENLFQTHKSVELEKASIRHKRFFEEETEALKADIRTYETAKHTAESNIRHQQSRQELEQKKWEVEEKSARSAFAIRKEKLESRITALNKTIEGIDFRIQNSKNSFYGWLNAKHPGWEHTIGKVVDDEVLFSSGLSPEKTGGDPDSFFGVKIDLEEIGKTVKTVADYEKEKEAAAEGIEAIHREIQVEAETLAEELEKLKRKYQPRIKECKDAVSENRYLLEQNTNRLAQARVKLDQLASSAAAAKQKELDEINQRLEHAAAELAQAREALARTEDELKKQLRARERERDKKIEEELSHKTELLSRLDSELKERRAAHKQKADEISRQQQSELTDKGANVRRISEINDRQVIIRSELSFIDKNRDRVAEYNKDKRELLDRIEEFKGKKVLQEQKLQQEEQKYHNQKISLQRDLDSLYESMQLIRKEQDQITDDLSAFEAFALTDSFKSIEYLLAEATDAHKTPKRPGQLIDELNEAYYSGIKRVDELKEAIHKFLGNFSSQNIFNFKTTLVEREDYWDFADNLSSFIEEDKISDFENRVNERFASIIRTIGQETTNLVSREGEIQGIINKINKDFVEKNFVGAIKKIELKLDESANKVVHILKLIKTFNDENSYTLGAVNLFSSPAKQEAQNKKAVELLKYLVREINNAKREYISLSDSFELKFRIEENQNDTGWVEKLSNVGSEGTDILVKAMINIMLLNVFKEGASRKFREFRLHCMMDEIGRLHPSNVRGILKFANDRNILLINGSPTENDALAYRHIYKLDKDADSITRVKRIITQYAHVEVSQYN